jgi:hypothetical protein
MEYTQAMFGLRVPGDGFSQYLMQPGGHYLDDARNQCVDQFLNGGNEDVLLYIDDDQASFNLPLVRKLLDTMDDTHRIVCGWYLSTLPSGVGPVVFDWGPHPTFKEHFNPLSVDDIKNRERDGNGLIEVAAAGTGFMALRRDLITDLRKEFPLPTSPFAEAVINGVHCGEDLTICARVRSMGEKVYVHPDVHVGHVKTVELKVD